MRFLKNRRSIFLWVLILFILDRASKYYFVLSIFNKRCFFISLVKNQDMAFGFQLGANFRYLHYLIIILIIFLLADQAIRLIKQKKNTQVLCLLLIIAGAVSNLIDRFKFGYVIDFIDIKIWPIFNIADIMIVSGALLLIINILKRKNSS